MWTAQRSSDRNTIFFPEKARVRGINAKPSSGRCGIQLPDSIHAMQPGSIGYRGMRGSRADRARCLLEVPPAAAIALSEVATRARPALKIPRQLWRGYGYG